MIRLPLPFTQTVVSMILSAALFSAAAFNTSITVNTSQDNQPISPYIYGTNQDLSGSENFSAFRQGGNRMTGYNWENNASNAGADWKHSSDNFIPSNMGIPNSHAFVPGIAITAFIDSCRKKGRFSLATFQMAGYVSRDKLGTVDSIQTAPSSRWCAVAPKKPAAFSATPDTSDSAVYMDELMNFLDTRYAAATDAWLGGICLDNEPALWVSTHPRIHVTQPTCRELLDKSVALSMAIKNVDAKPLVFGPVTYGFGEMYDFQTAPDWSAVKGTHTWFVSWYLEKFKAASETAGKRLLDVFDFHWYPEARGNNERIVFNSNPTNRANAEARLQAPRTLWDSNYLEDSWIAEWNASYLPILPKVKTSIATCFPGTKLSISEYNYGGENHISGGLAMADVFGIYGKYGVDFGFYWQSSDSTAFTSAAFKLYRNYNGSNGLFGAVSVQAATSDSVRSSAYASLASTTNNELHLILLNKNYDSTMNSSISITSPVAYESSRIWYFDSSSATIRELLPAPTISGNSFTCAIPKLTACHVVLTPSTAIASRITGPERSFCHARVDAHRLSIAYAFRKGETGTVTLHALNGTLLRTWRSLSGCGAISLEKRAFSTTAAMVLAWQSNGTQYTERVILVR
jgi:mannan endo-1,4-beta-mannosidase